MNPNAQAAFPKTRFRRARQSAQTRALIRENRSGRRFDLARVHLRWRRR